MVSDNAALLTVAELTKTYPPSLQALRDVDLSINAGEIVALLGANGAGKSTLAKLLTGVESPTSGAIFWEGKPTELPSPAAAKETGIGIVYQELNLLPNLTAAENILLGNTGTTLVHPFSRRRAERVYVEYAARLPGPPKPRRLTGALGVGQRQKVAIIRALSQKPKLLIIDEGTSSWNFAERQEFQNVLKHLAHENGIAIVYITHFIDDAINASDRVVVLRDGTKVYEAEPRDVGAYGEIISAISGDAALTVDAAAAEEPVVARARSTAAGAPPALVLDGLQTRNTGPLDLEVRTGECVGFYGYPGCGATEAIEAIAGLVPHRGIVSWNGARLKRGAVNRIRRNVVFCTGDRGRQVIPGWPVYLNVGLSRLFKGSMLRPMPKKQFRQAAEAVVSGFGVKGDATTPIGALSGGNQQKVIIGSGLELGRPLLLLGDDITRGIDAVARAELHRIIKATLQEDVAIVTWSTDPAEITELCTRVYIFAEGNIVSEFTGDEITTERLEYAARTRGRNTKGA